MEPSYEGYYETRFRHDSRRESVWRAIVGHLLKRGLLSGADAVLELGAGYCHFINNVPSASRHALDISPEVRRWAQDGVHVYVQRCDEPLPMPDSSMDVVFASNLFEHLTPDQMDRSLVEVKRVLRPGGRVIAIQPNFRYCYARYFDDYTHVRAFSHVSLRDLLAARGFAPRVVVARFLPFSMESRLPTAEWLVRLYLRLPVRPFARQMLVASEKAADQTEYERG